MLCYQTICGISVSVLVVFIRIALHSANRFPQNTTTSRSFEINPTTSIYTDIRRGRCVWSPFRSIPYIAASRRQMLWRRRHKALLTATSITRWRIQRTALYVFLLIRPIIFMNEHQNGSGVRNGWLLALSVWLTTAFPITAHFFTFSSLVGDQLQMKIEDSTYSRPTRVQRPTPAFFEWLVTLTLTV